MQEKTFLQIFSRYQPSAQDAAVFSLAKKPTVRLTKDDPPRVEVDLPFDSVQDFRLFYRVEEEITKTYSLRSLRIFPKYPASAFSLSSVPEIMAEAEHIGAVTHGFFADPQFKLEGDDLFIDIPFTASGIQLLDTAKTDRLLEGIIASRYAKTVKVHIRSSADAEEKEWKRRRENEESMHELDRMLAERAAAMPVGGSEGQHAFPRRQNTPYVDEHPDFDHRRSLGIGEAVCEEIEENKIKIGDTVFSLASPSPIYGELTDFSSVCAMKNATEGKNVFFIGSVFENGSEEVYAGERPQVRVRIGFSDGTSSLYVRMRQSLEEGQWAMKIKVGQTIAVRGSLARDKFDNELCMTPRAISRINTVIEKDPAEVPRVELHLHTNMSTMDALIRPADLVRTATAWGHKAVAVTDHGNVQSFPEVMKELDEQKSELKILYGMEAYYVNDTARVIYGDLRPQFDDDTVVFDIETTGLSPVSCHITEIGAVRLRGGEVVDTFNTFVDPEVPIPAEITRLTSITDEMVKGAPKVKEALTMFFSFAAGSMLVAHNANFDIGFIRLYAEKSGLPFHYTYLDTLSLSQYVNPELKNHKLDTIAEAYALGDFNHHRACDDASMLAAIFRKMQERLRNEGILTYDALLTAMSDKADPLQLKPRHMIILVKNQTGLKNLYKIVSESYLKYYKRFPRVPKSLLEHNREGLIIGSACEAGELFTALLEGRPNDEIEEIASFYDYLEIQPLCNNRFLIQEGKVAGDEQLMELNRRIVSLGKKLGKPVVATCDAHFLKEEDEIYRKIILAGQKFDDCDKDTHIYYRQTAEMLSEFAYLGERTAYEVVVENTNKIADMIEKIRPIPEGRYEPVIPGSDEDLKRLCFERAHDWYGNPLPEIVSARLNKELDSIISHGFAVLYMIAQKLVAYSESLGYQVGSRGSVGSSFVASMAGISEVNPLPPHYRCPKCKHTEFVTDGSVGSGFDLPDKNCPVCGTPLIVDGHDIPFETFLGFKGDKSPDIDLNFSGDVLDRVHKYTEDLFGKGHAFRAGTTSTLADKTAYGYVMKYLEERKISLPKAEVSRIAAACMGVKRTTGQHPGGIIVVPKEYEITDFSPVQHPADDPRSDIITTHFQFSYLHETILKLDELGHDMPTKFKVLEKYTDTKIVDVKMNDPEVYRLFSGTEPLGVTPEQIHSQLGTLGIPEMGTHFGQQLLIDAKPKNFADLLQVSGLSHGTNVWVGNAKDLIKQNVCGISEVVGTRDGIMLTMIRYGLDNSMSFKIMEDVRKGKGLTPQYEAAMREHGVPDWYIASCKKIKYMFPKAHAAAYVMSAIRLAWYKIYYPMEFYAAFLTVAPGGFNAEIVSQGREFVYQTIKSIQDKGNEATQKESDTATTLELVGECLCRGIRFLPVNIWKSDASAFLPENGNIRMPFSSLPGLGDAAGKRIVQMREAGEIHSIEDLQLQGGISRAVIDLLRRNGALEGVSETAQLSLF